MHCDKKTYRDSVVSERIGSGLHERAYPLWIGQSAPGTWCSDMIIGEEGADWQVSTLSGLPDRRVPRRVLECCVDAWRQMGPNKMTLNVQCNCCDYFTLSERGGWEICPVCFWEDDGFGQKELDFPSGANHGLTLREGRINFNQLGACFESMRSKVIAVEARSRFRYAPRQM